MSAFCRFFPLEKSLLNKFVDGFKIRFKVQTWSFPQYRFWCVRSVYNFHLYNKCSLIRSKCTFRVVVWTEEGTAYLHSMKYNCHNHKIHLDPIPSIFVFCVSFSFSFNGNVRHQDIRLFKKKWWTFQAWVFEFCR